MEFQIRCAGFAVITRAALLWMAGHIGPQPATEIGAGNGALVRELQALGVAGGSTAPTLRAKPLWLRPDPVQHPKPDAEAAVRHFPNPALIWRWPEIAPYTDRALAAFCESPNARKLIYTGEADGGCTGSREFQQILKTRFSHVDSCNIPSFFNCHDRCQLFSW